MDVWRRKPSAVPSALTSGLLQAEEGARAATSAAVTLVREINVLLSVANDSSDFHTKTVRLASAKLKLSELQAIVLIHPFIRLTSLVEVRAGIARIENELLGIRMREESEAAMWVFSAAFYLDTPFAALQFHGVVQRGPRSRLPEYSSDRTGNGWSLALPTLREMGLDVNDPPIYVASAIGQIPAHGGSFLPFLMLFRRIVESHAPLDKIEAALESISGRDEFTATVFEQLGPARSMIRRAGIH